MNLQDNLDRTLIDSKTVLRALERFSLTRTGSLSDRVGRLILHIDKLNENEDLLTCNNCGADCPSSICWCPFCGDEDEPPVELVKAVTLDESVELIQKAAQSATISTWDLGEALRQNLDDELWKQRLGRGKKPKYKTVNEFWNAELGYSHTHCYKLIKIARGFTREDAAGLSGRKLRLILQAPKAERSKLAADAKAQPAAKGKQAKGKQAKKSGDNGSTPKSERIVVSYAPKKQVVQMLAFPVGGGQPEPATKEHACAWAEIELDNHVMVVEVAENPDGQLEMLIKFDKV
jgi:hypothetical protein